MKKNQNGITLIALVVTIIVLLILAGITIQVVLQGGIFEQANKASESYKIADLRDRIDIIRMAWIADKAVDTSLPITDLWDRLIAADIIATYDDVEGPEKDESGNDIYILNTKEGYTVEIIVNDKGHIEIGTIVKGALPPVVRRIEAITTDTGMTAKAIVSRLKDGIVEYWYKLSNENDNEYKKMNFVSQEEGAKVELTPVEGTTYVVKAVAKNEAGEHELTAEITIGVKVKGLTLDKTEATIKPEGTLQLVTSITPENAENKKITWTSSNEAVATVDENGLVTGVAIGNATITAITTDGSGIKAICTITVVKSSLAKLVGQPAKTTNQTVYDDYGNKVVVPAGFIVVANGGTNTALKVDYTYSGDGDPNVQDGVVIQDNEGNQFVWIPVGTIKNKDNTTTTITLGRYTFNTSNGTPNLVQNAINYSNSVTISSCYQELANSSTNTPARALGTFINKTNNSRGYYLARYEASEGSDGKADSQANKMPWNDINQGNAAMVARQMYSSNYFESDLVNSYMWDTSIVFIQNYSGNSNYANKTSKRNSMSPFKAGTLDDVVCNIHDMAGNCYEWTTENSTNGDNVCTTRGGTFSYHADACTAKRYNNSTTVSGGNKGLRVGIYIK